MTSKEINVVLVTFNRLECLKVVLNALCKQTVNISNILLVDNHSNDGTCEYLVNCGLANSQDECVLQKSMISNKTSFMYYRTQENLGGSGGFAKAIELIKDIPADYLWIMDDDVRPEPNCLELLLTYMSDTVQACIPNRTDENFDDVACKNIDFFSTLKFQMYRRKSFYPKPYIEDYYSVCDMAFEGPLISMEIIKKIGLPEAGFFIEYDDTDYAQRILEHTKILFITKAILHRQLAKKSKIAEKKNRKYNWRYYYAIRNNILFNHKYGKTLGAKHVGTALLWLFHTSKSIYFGQIENIKIINKAVKDGILNKYGKNVNPGDF